jgi:Protein of unknown function (DUF1593)
MNNITRKLCSGWFRTQVSSRVVVLAPACAALWATMALACALADSRRPPAGDRTRLVVLTDIGNEPDDQMSLVRLLLYSNEMDIQGLIATTSTWKRAVVSPEMIRSVIDAYGRVRDNLLLHEPGWPTVDALNGVVAAGRAAYGMTGLESGPLSEGARLLLRAAQKDDARPLWITIWGGASTLAEALQYARQSLKPEQLAQLVGKLRIYSISDQDDAGPWIRREFPQLFYIVKPSLDNGEDYASATWTGISGDLYYRNGEGADPQTVTQEWLQANIRAKGPLGAHYPKHLFIMEGDTPSYLGLIPNGLNSERDPSWGGWGGRYYWRQPFGETHSIWSQGGDLYSRVTSADTVTGIDGLAHTSDQATIWRWRTAYQHDFAARMDWTIKDRAHANHPPQVIVNGDATGAPIEIDVNVGDSIELDASGSTDPDGDAMDFSWFQYAEAGLGTQHAALGSLTLEGVASPHLRVRVESTCHPNWVGVGPCGPDGVAHVILAVTDHGTPSLTRYRRVILKIHARASAHSRPIQ